MKCLYEYGVDEMVTAKFLENVVVNMEYPKNRDIVCWGVENRWRIEGDLPLDFYPQSIEYAEFLDGMGLILPRSSNLCYKALIQLKNIALFEWYVLKGVDYNTKQLLELEIGEIKKKFSVVIGLTKLELNAVIETNEVVKCLKCMPEKNGELVCFWTEVL